MVTFGPPEHLCRCSRPEGSLKLHPRAVSPRWTLFETPHLPQGDFSAKTPPGLATFLVHLLRDGQVAAGRLEQFHVGRRRLVSQPALDALIRSGRAAAG